MRRVVKSKQVKQKFHTIVSLFHEESEQLLSPPLKVKFSMNSPYLKKIQQQLSLTAKEASIPILTASQIGTSLQMFVMNQTGSSERGWKHPSYENTDDFKPYINPKILKGRKPFYQDEWDVSFPFIEVNILRYETIDVEYWVNKKEKREQQLSGFQSYMFQHCYDYTVGRNLLDWRLHFGNIALRNQVKEKLPKSNQIIDQYSKSLKKNFEEYPELKKHPQEADSEWFNRDQESMSIEQDFYHRVRKHYQRQMLILLQKIQLGLIKSS